MHVLKVSFTINFKCLYVCANCEMRRCIFFLFFWLKSFHQFHWWSHFNFVIQCDFQCEIIKFKLPIKSRQRFSFKWQIFYIHIMYFGFSDIYIYISYIYISKPFDRYQTLFNYCLIHRQRIDVRLWARISYTNVIFTT